LFAQAMSVVFGRGAIVELFSRQNGFDRYAKLLDDTLDSHVDLDLELALLDAKVRGGRVLLVDLCLNGTDSLLEP